MSRTKSGIYRSATYNSWANMKQRCNNSKHPLFKLWGGRGISYDKKWENFESFYNEMAGSFKKGLTLDRIDNNGNYCKDNCRWATAKQQAENTRLNNKFEYMGIKDTLQNWADYLKINRSTLSQ